MTQGAAMSGEGGTTRLMLGRGASGGGAAGGAAPAQDALLEAVRRAVAGHFDVLGAMGQGAGGKIVYLARDLASGALVALQLTPGGDTAGGEMWLDVLRQLDGAVPAGEGSCPRCGHALRGWLRFCGQCGADLSGVVPGGGDGTAERLLQAVRVAAGTQFEVLGPMDRADGGGPVYFACETESGRIVALRLERDPAAGPREQYSLGRTMVLDRVVESLAGRDPTPPPVRPDPAPPAVRLATDASAGRDSGHRASPLPPGAPLWIAGAAGLLALGVVGGLWVGRGRSQPPAPAPSAVAVPAAALAPVPDSGVVRIGGALPRGARITVDGEPLAGTSLRLPAGTYVLRAAARGYEPLSEELEVPAGQTVVWAPRLARATAVAVPKPRPASPGPRPTPSPAPSTPSPESPAAPVPSAAASACAALFAQLDWSRALPACSREAAAGDRAAQRSLAGMYERGLGTTADPAAAASWYARAAEAGDRVAQYRLALFLRDGHGVKRDEGAAAVWLGRAAAQGSHEAEYALGQMYERGRGVRKDHGEAAQWYGRAAEAGQADAQYALGMLHLKGDGVAKSDAQAQQWLRRAAAQGHRAAADELRRRGWAP